MRPSSIFDAVRAVANRVRGLGTRDTERADLEAELHFHREQLEAELRNRGLTPAEARRQAAVRLGNTIRWVEGGGDAWRFGRLESVVQDARVAARQWRRTPLTAAIAVLSLAIGVGFNTGISSLVNAAILRPLPVPAPEALHIVNTDGEAAGSYLPWPLIQRLREEGRPALALAAVTPLRDLGLDHGGVVALTPRGGSLVSDNYFEMLGVQPALGRLFRTGDEDEGTADHLVVLSHAFWQTTFGCDSTIVGRTLRFNGTSMQVIGVAARGFTGTQAGAAPDAWFPLTADDALLHRNAAFRSERTNWWVQAIGRQAAGEAAPDERLSATLRAFRMELEGPDASAETQAAIAAAHITLEDGRSGFGALRVQYAGALELLWGLSLLVWLITLVNVATLLLGRLRSRDLEFAVRRAMGASRARIAWQVAAEGGWLAAGGIVLALVVLRVGGPAARAWLFPAAARLHLDFGVDATMGMAIGISIVVSFLALAVFPALATAARTPSGTTTGDGRVAAR
ncbi:MAG: ABC transporter permease, partial [Gemmatimonadetes bacterium]|nr:ABC transporter permease [Gemmatimonadota bacterium]